MPKKVGKERRYAFAKAYCANVSLRTLWAGVFSRCAPGKAFSRPSCAAFGRASGRVPPVAGIAGRQRFFATFKTVIADSINVRYKAASRRQYKYSTARPSNAVAKVKLIRYIKRFRRSKPVMPPIFKMPV